MNYVDVVAEYPALATEFAYASPTQTLDLAGNVGVTVGAWRVRHSDLVLFTGLDFTANAWEPMHITDFDVPVEGGWRWYGGHLESFVRPYWELTGGPHLLLVLINSNPPNVDAALGTSTGLGLSFGRGDNRVVVGVRARGLLGVDQITGTVIAPSGTGQFWQWTPVRGSVGVYAGVGFQ